MRAYPTPEGNSYVAKAERAVSASGHVVVDMADFPSIDQAPADVCISRVRGSDREKGCDVYVGIFGTRYGSPVRNLPEVSYTELEFDTATAAEIPRLVFLLDTEANDLGLPPKALIDLKYGARQEVFLKRVRDSCLTVQSFSSPDELSQLVERSLKALAGGSSSAAKTYTSADLDAWVERHREAVARRFEALPAVQVRHLHVDLPVALVAGGKRETRLLEPSRLQHVVEEPGTHLILITGEGGSGKTSLAFRIARWGLGLDPQIRLAEHTLLPVLIDTALIEGDTLLSRVRQQLEQATGTAHGGIEENFVVELLRQKRILVIVDHYSELPEDARQRVLNSLPTGVLIITSRQEENQGIGELASTRIEPLHIAINELQPFFINYLEIKGVRQKFSEDELEPSQKQLRRIVGSKPITPLLAQMFIDDVIAKKEEQGLLAGSVPELMLAYVQRIDGPIGPQQRRRVGLEISPAIVERSMKVLALASLEQVQGGRPRYQPLDFSTDLAEATLSSDLAPQVRSRQVAALLGYLLEHSLLLHPGQSRTRLCFPLDPLADYLGAMEQLDRLLGAAAVGDSEVVWKGFLAPLIERDDEERVAETMGGFLLALRDCCLDWLGKDAAAPIPVWVPDRLGRLGGLDPVKERERLVVQRARRWIYELSVPEEDDRAAALERLASMVSSYKDDIELKAICALAGTPLAKVAADSGRPLGERHNALISLGLISDAGAIAALLGVMAEDRQPLGLRRAAAEALGLCAAGRGQTEEDCLAIADALEALLRSQPVEAVVQKESDWEQIDAVLPLLQGAARGLQLAVGRDLPLLGSGAGRVVPMLTLTARQSGAGKELAISTEVVEVPVWKLPLPEGQHLEMVMVPGGKYLVGSPEEEEGRNEYNHAPECAEVEVEKQRALRLASFVMARFPVSQAQWAAVARTEVIERELSPAPGSYKPESVWERYCQPGGLPVVSVSWLDCHEWLARLNHWLAGSWAEQGGAVGAPVLALPSESQWEAACRARSTSPFNFGDTLDASWANYEAATYTYASGRKGKCLRRPTPIGAYGLVNRWGLAEMHGHLFEWCEDFWHPSPLGVPKDGSAWMTADPALQGMDQQKHKLLRGGSWSNGPRVCRSSFRLSGDPADVPGIVGVRPCCHFKSGFLLHA